MKLMTSAGAYNGRAHSSEHVSAIYWQLASVSRRSKKDVIEIVWTDMEIGTQSEEVDKET